MDAEAACALAHPDVRAQIGHLISLHPVHEDTRQSAKDAKQLKTSRAVMWWTWRGSGARASEFLGAGTEVLRGPCHLVR